MAKKTASKKPGSGSPKKKAAAPARPGSNPKSKSDKARTAKKTASKATTRSAKKATGTSTTKPAPAKTKSPAKPAAKAAAKPATKSGAKSGAKPATKAAAKAADKTSSGTATKTGTTSGTPSGTKSDAKPTKMNKGKKPASSVSAKAPAPASKAAKKSTTKPAGPKSARGEDTAKSPEGARSHATKKPAPAAKPKPEAPPASASATPPGDDKKKTGRKGITIVEPSKKAPSKSKSNNRFQMPERPMLLGPGSKFTKPLIPSGPKAPKVTSVFDAPKSKRKKSPLTKAKIDHYRSLLIAKRAELLGDVESMEHEALRAGSGGLSHTPQHIAEQGSESYDQTLSLNLAAKDRRLIKEIDDALKRVEDGTYGLCELTLQPIPEPRLNELPRARYTIEAAREIERRGYPQ